MTIENPEKKAIKKISNIGLYILLAVITIFLICSYDRESNSFKINNVTSWISPHQSDKKEIKEEIEKAYLGFASGTNEKDFGQPFYNPNIGTSFAFTLSPIFLAGKTISVENIEVIDFIDEETANVKYDFVIKSSENEKRVSITMTVKKVGGVWKLDSDKFIPKQETQIGLDSKDFNFYYKTGTDYASKGDYVNAVRLFEKAIQMNPTFIDAYINLSNCYGMLKNYNKNIELLNKVLTISPNNAQALGNLAVTYELLGDKNKSEEYRIKLEETNTNTETPSTSSEEKKFIGDWKANFRKGLEIHIYQTLGKFYIKMGEDELSNVEYNEAGKQFFANPQETNDYSYGFGYISNKDQLVFTVNGEKSGEFDRVENK